MAGLGRRGLEARAVRGLEGSQQLFVAGLVQRRFLLLSKGRGSSAGHRSARSRWVAGAVPPLTQLLASLCLEAGGFQPFPPGQGSRAGHDLTQQPWPRCGHPVRPRHSSSSAHSPEVALNHTVGLVLGWFSRNNSLLVMTALGRPWDPARWGSATAHTPLEGELGPARWMLVVLGERMRRTNPRENYAFSSQISSIHSALGTILGAEMELLARQIRPSIRGLTF